VWGVAIVQLVLGSVTAALMVLVGRRLASATHNARYVGLVVGLATATYGPLVLFDAELLPPVVVNLLLVTALVLALRPGRVGLADAAIGLLGGIAVTGWPLSFALIPGLLALRARRVARPSQRALGINLPMRLTKTFVASEAERGVITTRALMFRREMPLADGLSDSLARRFPHDANVQMVRAEVLVMTKGCDLAIPYLEATVKLAPSTTTPRVMLGGCYSARGDESADGACVHGTVEGPSLSPRRVKSRGSKPHSPW
jgi:hypothetical protein